MRAMEARDDALRSKSRMLVDMVPARRLVSGQRRRSAQPFSRLTDELLGLLEDHFARADQVEAVFEEPVRVAHICVHCRQDTGYVLEAMSSCVTHGGVGRAPLATRGGVDHMMQDGVQAVAIRYDRRIDRVPYLLDEATLGVSDIVALQWHGIGQAVAQDALE